MEEVVCGCSAEQEGSLEAAGWVSLEGHLGRGGFVLFSRNRDTQAPMGHRSRDLNSAGETGANTGPLCMPQKLLLPGFPSILDPWMSTRSCFPVAHSSLSDLKCL